MPEGPSPRAVLAGWDAFWVSTGLLALLGALIAVRLPPPVPGPEH